MWHFSYFVGHINAIFCGVRLSIEFAQGRKIEISRNIINTNSGQCMILIMVGQLCDVDENHTLASDGFSLST